MVHQIALKDIFIEKLEKSISSYKYSMHDELKSYLYKLYVEDLFANSFRKPNGTLDTLIFLDELPKSKETLEYLKFNGDYHLSIAGYVPEAFCNKYVEFDYYISIGRYSYYRLHQRMPSDKVYKSLAFDYLDVVYILNQTFDYIKKYNNLEVIKIIDAWKDTNHPIFKKRLIRLGFSDLKIDA